MSKLPRLRGRQVIAALRKAGFLLARTRGSHHILKHSDGRTTVVPIHAGETIGQSRWKTPTTIHSSHVHAPPANQPRRARKTNRDRPL